MFKRIKNLLDISRYSVEDLRTTITTKDQYIQVRPGKKLDYDAQVEMVGTYPAEPMEFKPATIINMIEVDPFADITNETTQQSPDDTATRN